MSSTKLGPAGRLKWRGQLRRRWGALARETPVLWRAGLSSVIATTLNALVYQGVLLVHLGSYTAAALSGAALGAVTNFSINRAWAFPPSGRELWRQAVLYACASTLTYFGLQAGLMVQIELLGLDPRLAWAPAALLSWACISYPLFRRVVFARPPALVPERSMTKP